MTLNKAFHRCYSFPLSAQSSRSAEQPRVVEITRLHLYPIFRIFVHFSVHIPVLLATWRKCEGTAVQSVCHVSGLLFLASSV
jgi:hypothetical protein